MALDLEKVDARFLTLPYSQHKLESYIFRGITFHVKSNRNLKHIKFVIDGNGELQIRINPECTWRRIRASTFNNFVWVKTHYTQISREFDSVGYIQQKIRNNERNSLVYLFGVPYLVDVKAQQGQDNIQFSRPEQVIPVLLPKGTSRYATKIAALTRNGYLNKKALESLPIINQSHVILPKHCLWDEISDFDYDVTKVAPQLQNPDDPYDVSCSPRTGNYYLDAFCLTMQEVQDCIKNDLPALSSRMLTNPKRLLVEHMIDSITRHINHESIARGGLNVLIERAEMYVRSVKRQVLKGSIDQKANFYPVEPFNNFDLFTVAKLDNEFSLDMKANFESKEGINFSRRPARMCAFGTDEAVALEKERGKLIENGHATFELAYYPGLKDYLSMTREQAEEELHRQLYFYRSGSLYSIYEDYLQVAPDEKANISNYYDAKVNLENIHHHDPSRFSDPVIDLYKTGYSNIGSLELTLMTVSGKEINPSLVLYSLLDDKPATNNEILMGPSGQTKANVLAHSTKSYRSIIAGTILGEPKQLSVNDRFFHKTLTKPGIIFVNLSGKNSKDKVRKMLLKRFNKILHSVALNFFNNIREQYESVHRNTALRYRINNFTWFDPLIIKRLTVLGQYRRWGKKIPEIALNWDLVHYPPNVMMAVIMHELCHIAAANHGPAFQFALDMFCPESDNISNSTISLGIIPLSKTHNESSQ